jgi:transcriptional regulator with XRE-family HTH domain
MVNFSVWLDQELSSRSWTRADLAQKAQISQSTLSLIYNESRKAGPDVCRSIADALKIPPEEVFRAAGLLPPTPKVDVVSERANHLLQMLKKPTSKQRAVDYLELLIRQEAREENEHENAAPKNYPTPSASLGT